MDFSQDSYDEFIKYIREFAQNTVAPTARYTDENEAFPVQTVLEMQSRKLFGIPFDSEWGGSGQDYLSYALAIEEIAKCCASTAVILSTHTSLCCLPISLFGNKLQKEKYLRQLLAGERLGAFALTEPGAGSDVLAISTNVWEEDDCFILNGEKVFITNAGYAGVYIVFAKNSGGKLSALLVTPEMPGFCIAGYEKKMGIRGSTAGNLQFKNCIVPKENLLGGADDGFKIAMTALDGGRIAIAAQALGIAEAALHLAVEYTKERKQFGRSISEFQNTRFTLAQIRTEFEAGRYLMLHAAWLHSKGLPHTKEAAMAKLKCSQVADLAT
ncbi:MAG: acyl-CoA dehydrogenase family protein, partial [Eubacteriales bacterium]